MRNLQSPASATRSDATPAPVRAAAVPSGIAEALTQAQASAAAASDIAALRAAVESYEGCGLKRTAKHTVFGDGNPAADILFIGEAPGEDEDRQGIPFCGRSGQLLTRMLQAIGLEREADYFISNSIYWRPPGNRAPSAEEIALCRPFVQRLITLLRPRMVILVGGIAAKAVLEQEATVAQLRRSSPACVLPGLPAPVPTRVLYHPAYLLRSPAQKAAAWKDLLALHGQLKPTA